MAGSACFVYTPLGHGYVQCDWNSILCDEVRTRSGSEEPSTAWTPTQPEKGQLILYYISYMYSVVFSYEMYIYSHTCVCAHVIHMTFFMMSKNGMQ